MKILLTGGHAGTTGLSVIEEIRRRDKNISLYWIGQKSAISGTSVVTIEQRIYPKYDVKYYPIDGGKVQTKFTEHSLQQLLKIPFGFLRAMTTVFKIKPDIIVSFGGSISYPVTLVGYLMRIPVVIHEQTSAIGRANQLASKFANVIAVSRESSIKYFGNKNIVITGNPLNSIISKYQRIKPKGQIKTILVTGGSRGSTWINNAIQPILSTLIKKYKVIWQVGEANLDKYKVELPNLKICGQLDPSEMISVISSADLVIARSGANTISELIALRKPAILIPIPWVYKNEQFENAMYMKNLGIAEILPQKDLNPESLLVEIKKMEANYNNISKQLIEISSRDIGASKRFTDLIFSTYENKKI